MDSQNKQQQQRPPEYRIALLTDSPHGVFVLQQSFDADAVVGAFNGVCRWRDGNGAVYPVVFPAGANEARLFGTEQIDALRRGWNRLDGEYRRLRRLSFASLCVCAAIAGILCGFAGGWAAARAARNEPLAERAGSAGNEGNRGVAEKTPEAGRGGAGGAGSALGVERDAAGDGEALHHEGVGVVEGGRVRAVEEPVEKKPMDERPRDGASGVDIGESGIHGVVHAESVAEAPEGRKDGGEHAAARDGDRGQAPNPEGWEGGAA